MSQIGTFSVCVSATHIAPEVKSGNLSMVTFLGSAVDVSLVSVLTGALKFMLTCHCAVGLTLTLSLKHDFYGDRAIVEISKLG